MTVIILAVLPQQLFSAERPELIEIRTDKERYQGKLIAHNKQDSWILGRDGQIHKISIRDVRGFRKLSSKFRGISASELRTQLRRNFGKNYEIVGSGHYLVIAQKGRARQFAKIFEETYRSVYGYLSVYGFRLRQPKYPLVAVVFSSHIEFIKQASRDGVNNPVGVLGYYSRRNNRIVLFEPTPKIRRVSQQPQNGPFSDKVFGDLRRPSGIRPSLFDTMIHETTHQVSFNVGLHSRIGQCPIWIVEGLATMFEASGVRNRKGRRGSLVRANRERLAGFFSFAQKRRKKNSLASFIASDKMFRDSTLDAYSQAWALTFFLMETRSRQFSDYLKLIAKRDPLKPYTSKARLADFRKIFGDDLDRLENDFLRFIQRLK
ncbi:MAG: hypothetical protein Tsb009_36480 [Planctomycetaceae bacterium]